MLALSLYSHFLHTGHSALIFVPTSSSSDFKGILSLMCISFSYIYQTFRNNIEQSFSVVYFYFGLGLARHVSITPFVSWSIFVVSLLASLSLHTSFLYAWHCFYEFSVYSCEVWKWYKETCLETRSFAFNCMLFWETEQCPDCFIHLCNT